MPGTFVFKPIEANLVHNTDLIGKMNPYCTFLIGNFRVRGEVCKKGGKHPHWNDAITIPMENESQIMVELMDKDKLSSDDNIGTFLIDLQEIQSKGQVTKWYPLTYKDKPAGEILMESFFQSKTLSPGATQSFEGEQIGMSQPDFIQQETITTQTPIIQEQVSVEPSANITQGSNVFIEQRQVVEPHTFSKAVDVVETRPVLKEIEVLEPVKVVKDVQYTEAVPVRKQIEVVEPQVVRKEVEVIEPRVVTKEIQVVENVPVMKEVEIVEPRTIVKEVETLEPQTFTKQVEVTEQVPVKKAVTVTEPVTVTKAVDFVEPIITTKTVTKEIQQPIVVDEKITTTVGPATVVGVETEFSQRVGTYGEARLSEEQRVLEQARLEEQRLLEEQKLLQGNQIEGYSTTTTTSTYQSGSQTGAAGQTYTNELNPGQKQI